MKILPTVFAVVAIGTLVCSGCDSDGKDRDATGGQSQAGAAEVTAGESGQGGAHVTPGCPNNIVFAAGTSCADYPEGFECSDGGTNPCEFGNAIVCINQVWERRESFPAPCAGAGGEHG